MYLGLKSIPELVLRLVYPLQSALRGIFVRDLRGSSLLQSKKVFGVANSGLERVCGLRNTLHHPSLWRGMYLK